MSQCHENHVHTCDNKDHSLVLRAMGIYQASPPSHPSPISMTHRGQMTDTISNGQLASLTPWVWLPWLAEGQSGRRRWRKNGGGWRRWHVRREKVEVAAFPRYYICKAWRVKTKRLLSWGLNQLKWNTIKYISFSITTGLPLTEYTCHSVSLKCKV